MELESIIKLIQAVSATPITSFEYEEGDMKLSIGIEGRVTVVKEQDVVRNISAESIEEPKVSTDYEITSPMVGTFYAAKKEGEAPFVQVGDTIEKGQIIGIVEAMKLMNEIESPFSGVVTEILVQNQEMVEYGQPLVRVK